MTILLHDYIIFSTLPKASLSLYCARVPGPVDLFLLSNLGAALPLSLGLCYLSIGRPLSGASVDLLSVVGASVVVVTVVGASVVVTVVWCFRCCASSC